MNKIQQAFENKKAFIPFITGGDPTLDVTEQLLYAMEAAGADLIEIGIPFSGNFSTRICEIFNYCVCFLSDLHNTRR